MKNKIIQPNLDKRTLHTSWCRAWSKNSVPASKTTRLESRIDDQRAYCGAHLQPFRPTEVKSKCHRVNSKGTNLIHRGQSHSKIFGNFGAHAKTLVPTHPSQFKGIIMQQRILKASSGTAFKATILPNAVLSGS